MLGGLCLSAAACVAFLVVEHHSSDPMLPLGLFRRRMFRSGSTVGMLINLGFYGQLFVMSLYFQDIRGYSALRAGLVIAAAAFLAGATVTFRGVDAGTHQA